MHACMHACLHGTTMEGIPKPVMHRKRERVKDCLRKRRSASDRYRERMEARHPNAAGGSGQAKHYNKI